MRPAILSAKQVASVIIFSDGKAEAGDDLHGGEPVYFLKKK
jgi:hypothetical protein